MALTKTKTAIVAGAIVVLAVVLVMLNVKQVPPYEVDEACFEESGEKGLDQVPVPVELLRDTHFGASGGSSMRFSGNRMVARNASFEALILRAYLVNGTRTILPPQFPKGGFDYLITMKPIQNNDNPTKRLGKVLQDLIRTKYGYTGRLETRETDVFLLKIKTAKAQSIKISTNHYSISQVGNKLSVTSDSLSVVARHIESSFQKPVIDQTGMNGLYDYELDFSMDEAVLRKNLLDQLGLELVPSREPLEMLVVEKIK